MEENNIINQYVQLYSDQIHTYKRTAAVTARICKQSLDEAHLRNWVSNRAKDPKSLENKLIQRQKHGHAYTTIEEIDKDIVDLAGVRIILYYAADRARVKSILHDRFKVKETRIFPDRANNKEAARGRKGYTAHHFRVWMRKDDMERHHLATDGLIEIQVISLFQHAWAEIEHDIKYKPTWQIVNKEQIVLGFLKQIVDLFDFSMTRLWRIQMKNRRLMPHN
ncbi:hypothetical protein ASPWEDRAFT_44911 [Aspergillus wentii DTO 134E9]|uniref:RelA/SpoT domain-containing protein n=1 Tax=Aspergillus wentii DTO 134E9 TaxID=1073089 RepID=A0A1L9R7R3_ASPWE|nr:uncharacterized protein ASPWEDRAFT_44911 [Aspergillus wentii DTO 134E9]OJJ30962.1 hypothetical protein ASPWEDRAFT_44911 [Aspergillus wentii DTO 134E9]